jgi:hypothetical protein
MLSSRQVQEESPGKCPLFFLLFPLSHFFNPRPLLLTLTLMWFPSLHPRELIQLIENRQGVDELLRLDSGSIDLVIPRGSNQLVKYVQVAFLSFFFLSLYLYFLFVFSSLVTFPSSSSSSSIFLLLPSLNLRYFLRSGAHLHSCSRSRRRNLSHLC